MRKNLKRAALTEEKSRPGKTGAMPQETTEALPRVVIVGRLSLSHGVQLHGMLPAGHSHHRSHRADKACVAL
jgi:hypothetical protein